VFIPVTLDSTTDIQMSMDYDISVFRSLLDKSY